MENTNLFDVILGNDEQILKVMKPNKVKTWFSNIFISAILLLFIFTPMLFAALTDGFGLEIFICVIIFNAISIALIVPFTILWYNKTVYAVTNKRIIIRTGFIGVDYKSLDFEMLSALTVNVSFVDKILRKNTGSISFGSMASPMVNNANMKFSFTNIEKPYETLKEIKEIINNYK